MTKSTRWFLGILGVLALLVGGFFLLLIFLFSESSDQTELVTYGSGEKIAVVEVNGVIGTSRETVRQLKEYREDRGIKAILLRIDSPGGGVVASQEIYDEVRKTRDGGKPVVVSMGALAASGGYYIACGGTKLVANPGTLTGSIGVIAEFLQLKDALNKIGVGITTIKSGRLKDAGSPTRPMTDEDKKYFQDLMDGIHRQFVDVVEHERNIPHARVVELSDGRVFTGENAVELGLVDTLGTFGDAVAIAARLTGIEGEPALVRERKRRYWWDNVFGEAAEGITELKREVLDRPVLSFRFVGP